MRNYDNIICKVMNESLAKAQYPPNADVLAMVNLCGITETAIQISMQKLKGKIPNIVYNRLFHVSVDYSKTNKLKIDYDNIKEINQQIEKCNREIMHTRKYLKLLNDLNNQFYDHKRWKNRIGYLERKKTDLIELRDLNIYYGWCYSELTRPLKDWEKDMANSIVYVG